MKRIVSLLVALALILSMSVTAFAAGEDQASAIDIANPEFFSQMIAEGDSCWFTYTAERPTKVTIGNYSGTEFTAADAAGTPITVEVLEDPWFGPSYSAVIEVAAGETAVWQVTTTGADIYYFEFSAEGEPTWPYVATVGSYTANIPEYGRVYYVYTPDADGVLTLTIDTDTTSDWFYSMGADDGWGYPGADANGAVRSDDSDVENDDLESAWYPNGHNPSRTIDVVAGVAYVLEISNVSGNAGQVAFTLSTEPGDGGEPGGNPGGGNPGGSIPEVEVPENGIAIESYGNAEWTAPEDGYVKFTINIPGASLAVLNENYSPLGEDVETVTVQVTAGATYGIYPVSVTTASIVTWEYVDAPAGGGDASESIPSGSALALGNNNVELTYAMMAMQAPYWTYTATEAGFLTVTVASINGNSGNMLAMPFGMGRYTLLVGETDGMGTNTATVAMNAGDSVNIAVLDTVDFEAVPAVLNLSFEAGTPAPEKNPADYFEQNPNGQYIIPSLETPVEIFVGNDDIYYVYVAENAGVVTVTPAVDGMTATNCWISYNGGSFDQNAAPVAVEAGGVVLINIWSGYEGTVSFAEGELGGGDEIESAPMSGENVDVAADGSLEIYYTPDADGILTIDISADPGYRVEVQNAATLDTVGLREESSLAQVLTYNLEAGVEYKITINGFSTATWDVAAATITYDITFEAGETSSDVADLDESDVALVLGEQNVELLPNAITTLYNFAAPEAGVYTVTIPDDAIAELYSAGWISYQICEGNTLVFTATEAEQNFLIGLTSEFDSMNIKIEKTGTYTPPAQTEYKDYVAKNEIEKDFAQPEEVVSVDITAEQTIVKGEDGYYHLGTADGPILMVNLNSEGFTLATLSNAITMRGEVITGQDGKPWGYDYMTMISEYYEYSRENDYHPLNDDLMAFFKDYGAAQGWYDQNMSGFDAIKAGNFNEESAWMVALVYVEGAGNQGGNNAQTGDFGVIAAAVALGMSAICGTAVITKKKEN